MRYLIHVEVDPEVGNELEQNPEQIQQLIGAWRAAGAETMFFSLSRRALWIVVDADNERAFFKEIAMTWHTIGDYPSIDPVVDVDEFPAVLAEATGG